MKFTVRGQPVPYTRTTQRAKFVSERWKKYADYKNTVVTAFLAALIDKKEWRKVLNNYYKSGKLIKTKRKLYVEVIMYFKDKGHGDPDNIFKGVLDALFVTDKYVAGKFDFFYDADNPRLEITINGWHDK